MTFKKKKKHLRAPALPTERQAAEAVGGHDAEAGVHKAAPQEVRDRSVQELPDSLQDLFLKGLSQPSWLIVTSKFILIDRLVSLRPQNAKDMVIWYRVLGSLPLVSQSFFFSAQSADRSGLEPYLTSP